MRRLAIFVKYLLNCLCSALGDGHNKDSDFQTIKGKKVMGVGLGNIFGGGPIKLRAVGDSAIKEVCSLVLLF